MINNRAQAYYLVNKIDEDLRLGKMENLVQQYLRSGIDVFSHQIYASTFAISNPFVKGFILADEAGLGKFMNFKNQKAQIVLEKNVLTIKTKEQTFEFVANQDNFIVNQNQGLLGGDVACKNGKICIQNQNPTNFESGQEYTIITFEFYDDMLGETTIKFEKTYHSLLLELKTEDNKFCDLQIDSDKILISNS